jgi:hypothetical protein
VCDVAGKLSVVLYGMLKNMTPYDQDKHRRQLGVVQSADQTGAPPVDVSLELVDLADSPNDLVDDDHLQVQQVGEQDGLVAFTAASAESKGTAETLPCAQRRSPTCRSPQTLHSYTVWSQHGTMPTKLSAQLTIVDGGELNVAQPARTLAAGR